MPDILSTSEPVYWEMKWHGWLCPEDKEAIMGWYRFLGRQYRMYRSVRLQGLDQLPYQISGYGNGIVRR